MGGGGGGWTSGWGNDPHKLSKRIRAAERDTAAAAFDVELSELLDDLLAGYNRRDAEAIQDRLSEIKDTLGSELGETFDHLFGGSVAKHTYVDGLSDIDSMLVINDTSLEGRSPDVVLNKLTTILRKALGSKASVEHGRMAVTVTYADGMQIQLLPAVRTGGKLQVPSSRRDGWSHIDPAGFRQALTDRNQECGGKLVPTIKLAKAIIGGLPEARRLSGYHVESLAIAAFKNYDSERTTRAMLPRFFERAAELVKSPIRDSSGQSVHVDAYLGAQDSDARMRASHSLSRIAREMRNASAASSEGQWRAIFDDD